MLIYPSGPGLLLFFSVEIICHISRSLIGSYSSLTIDSGTSFNLMSFRNCADSSSFVQVSVFLYRVYFAKDCDISSGFVKVELFSCNFCTMFDDCCFLSLNASDVLTLSPFS